MVKAGDEMVNEVTGLRTVFRKTAEDTGGEEVHALVEFEPALRAEVPLETLAGLARDGKVNGAGVPKDPFRLALLVHDYEDELYLASPPLFVQRAVFGPLALLGRLLGYQAEYPYPFARRGEANARLTEETNA